MNAVTCIKQSKIKKTKNQKNKKTKNQKKTKIGPSGPKFNLIKKLNLY